MARLFSIVLCALILLPAPSAFAQAGGALLPWYQPTFVNVDGKTPVANGFVCTTSSGGSSPLATYSDSQLLSANPNPIHLDSGGQPQNGGSPISIYMQNASYRITVYAAGTGNMCNGTSVGTLISQTDPVYDWGQKFFPQTPMFTNNAVIFYQTGPGLVSDPALTWNNSAQTLTITGAQTAGNFMEIITNTNSTSGKGMGLEVNAGATTSDMVVSVNSRTATPLFTVNGVGDARVAGGVVLPTATMQNTEVLYACPAPATGGLNKICGAGNIITSNSFTWGEGAGQVNIQNAGVFFPLQVTSTGGAGNNFGVNIIAGTTSADSPLFIQAANLTTLVHVFGDGGVSLSTWADEGLGNMNAANYYVKNTIGQSLTATVRNSAGSGTCTITFLGGLITASTC
jgi:hypothetical protein